jgi:hypothetical protein
MKRHGESKVSRARWLVRKANGRGEYASKDEFASIFECEQAGLQRLALLLTADSEAAKRCLICSFRDCVASISVSREWVVSWSRRVVIRNAISLLMGSEGQSFINTNDDAVNKLITFFSGDSPGALAEYESILELPEFERLIFVICVLEHYSVHDCALLLGRSPREIEEVRHRVGNQVGQIDRINNISPGGAMH